MAYHCRICGSNQVDHPGDICEVCAHTSGPSSDRSYPRKRSTNRKILLHGAAAANLDPYGNDMGPSQDPPPAQGPSAAQAPQSVSQKAKQTISSAPRTPAAGHQPLTAGITKNITLDRQKYSFLGKWFRSLSGGIPFALDNDVTLFQVFPTGASQNALGNACDQVIVYGRLNKGAVSEDNEVEVYGRRDSNNNIIAQKIWNKASGTTITSQRSIGAGAVWAITVIAVMVAAASVMAFGPAGIVWTAAVLLCLTNLPKVLKVIAVLLAVVISMFTVIFSLVMGLLYLLGLL